MWTSHHLFLAINPTPDYPTLINTETPPDRMSIFHINRVHHVVQRSKAKQLTPFYPRLVSLTRAVREMHQCIPLSREAVDYL